MEDSEVPMDRLTKIYIKIREKTAALTREYESQVEALKAQQATVASAMKTVLQAVGGEGMKTPYGTVSLITKSRFYAQDNEALKAFILEHECVELLEMRIAQTNMTKFLAANPGVVPPGLNTVSSIEVSVRKPTK